ncbi:MAG: sigma-70 family RNA polymerase sigma factor [Dehalococcoidia bacterium]
MLKILGRHAVINRGDMKIAGSISQSYETKLVEKLRSGDSTAREEFYNIYRNRLYSLVLEQVGRDEAVAEDLVQEAFLAALSSLDKFRGDSQLYTWLRSIAFHKINDFYRRQGREPKPQEAPPDFDAMKQLEQTGGDEPAAPHCDGVRRDSPVSSLGFGGLASGLSRSAGIEIPRRDARAGDKSGYGSFTKVG